MVSGDSGGAGKGFEETCSELANATQQELYRLANSEQICEQDADCTIAKGTSNCAWMCPFACNLELAEQANETLHSCAQFDALGCTPIVAPLCPNAGVECRDGRCIEVDP